MAAAETLTRDELLEAAALAASRADALQVDDDSALIAHELRALRFTIHAGIAADQAVHDNRDEPYEGWADVELMGHRSRVGHVREIRLAGKHFLEIRGLRKIDNEGTFELVEQLEIYAGTAIYSLTPIDEDQARTIASNRDDIPF